MDKDKIKQLKREIYAASKEICKEAGSNHVEITINIVNLWGAGSFENVVEDVQIEIREVI
ncbi:hypothetical protein NVP1197A_44 [Vibrio phage 1.197.A._10N.286.54.F2]|nr:hypothetical protein NVP1197A_44 [Vibrio phage 1.197.A._10N.286.54.F2]